MKTITKTAPRKFRITTTTSGGSHQLDLDFNPIIDVLSDREKKRRNHKIIHWQGAPKGSRQWGVYDPIKDSYMCSVFDRLPIMYGGSRLIMLDDETAISKPSAVIYYVGSDKFESDPNLTNSSIN